MYIKIAHSNGFSLVTMVGNKWAEVSKHEHEMHIERSSIIIYGHTNKSIKKKNIAIQLILPEQVPKH